MRENKQTFNLRKINRLKINIASSELIKCWTKREQIVEVYVEDLFKANKYLVKQTIFGEITSPLFFQKTRDSSIFHNKGIFSEVIFGPFFNFKCLCYKTKPRIHVFQDCPICHVSFTLNNVRNYRMGYIPLVSPIFNPLFISKKFNILNILFGSKETYLKDFIVCKGLYNDQSFYLKKLNETAKVLHLAVKASKGQIQHVDEVREIVQRLVYLTSLLDNIINKKNVNQSLKTYAYLFCINNLTANIDSFFNEQLFKFFKNYNFLTELRFINQEICNYKAYSSAYILLSRKLRLLENFYKTKTSLSSVMFKALPVIPPGFRPFDPDDIDGSTTSKINYLYQNILKINERLLHLDLLELKNKKSLLINEIKLLQDSINFLILNQKGCESQFLNDRPMSSLADVIRGKEGRFRKHILGKRINFSARTVIVVNPLLRITHCGIPLKILKNLLSFKIVKIINKIDLKILSKTKNIDAIYLDILKKLIKHEIVMLNRAPTLHKLGLQSFNVTITMNDAIQVHPLVCAAYNADFDGDQMAIYLPLTKISQIELNFLLKSTKDLFMFGNSSLRMKPTQELILGLNYLGYQNYLNKSFNFGNYFNDYNEFFVCFLQKKLRPFEPIWIKNNLVESKKFNIPYVKNGYVRITPGQLLVNKILSNNFMHYEFNSK